MNALAFNFDRALVNALFLGVSAGAASKAELQNRSTMLGDKTLIGKSRAEDTDYLLDITITVIFIPWYLQFLWFDF